MTELIATSPEHSAASPELDAADLVWLEPLAGRELDETDLTPVNHVIATGAKHLTDDIDPDTFSSVMKARRVFYEKLLGWDDETHPLHASYQRFVDRHERLMPLDTALATLRTYHELGLNTAKVINALPAALGLNSDSVRDKVAVLEELGLDATKVINALPAALSYNSDSVRDKVTVLEELGLDAAKVINAHQAALKYNTDSVRGKVAVLEELGLDAAN